MSEDFEVEIYERLNHLRVKAGASKNDHREGSFPKEMIEEANRIRQIIGTEGVKELNGHVDKLIMFWKGILVDAPESVAQESIQHDLMVKAHKVKDISGIAGYDLICDIAESLREFCKKFNQTKEHVIIIKAHIDAIQVIHKQDIKDKNSPEALALKEELNKAIEKYS